MLILKEKRLAEDLLGDAPTKPQKPKSNPWRNFKHGKALYHRTNPPKL
jgi:hypothetical protein